MRTRVVQREGAILKGCPGHSKALAIFGAAVASALLPHLLKRDHPIASNVMQQKIFSMPGKRK